MIPSELEGKTCDYYVNPFAEPDDPGAFCGKPAQHVTTFRRKSDGLTETSPRCEEHRYKTNEKWAPDTNG